MKTAVLGILRAYKRWISPTLPVACRYLPTCSEYAMEAVETHGIFRGLSLAAWRLARCNPFGGSGYDPVPHVHSDCNSEDYREGTCNRLGRAGLQPGARLRELQRL